MLALINNKCRINGSASRSFWCAKRLCLDVRWRQASKSRHIRNFVRQAQGRHLRGEQGGQLPPSSSQAKNNMQCNCMQNDPQALPHPCKTSSMPLWCPNSSFANWSGLSTWYRPCRSWHVPTPSNGCETDMVFYEELAACSETEQMSDLKLVASESTIHNLLVDIVPTLPVTKASNERMFSTLGRVKTYLRQCCGDQRLSDLLVFSCLSENAKDLDLWNVVDNFARLKSRRYPLIHEKSEKEKLSAKILGCVFVFFYS